MTLEDDIGVASPGTRAQAGVAEDVARILDRMAGVVQGKPDAVHTALTVFLAGGHLLIEDVPGVGKTVLVKALARCLGCSVQRIQFTPDLLPSDVTGVSVFDQAHARFDFRPGPVFADIVIGDEINRASPKTQAALLECMAERQVTVDGVTYPLAESFTVFATQNPIEMEGTYALPEAQRDRFTARIAMGYPDRRSESAMLTARDHAAPLEALTPVVDRERIHSLRRAVQDVFVSAPVRDHIVDIVRATREDPDVLLGASPRATLQLLAVARASAAMDGRDFVIPDDVDRMAVPVLAHRIILARRARADGAAWQVASAVVERACRASIVAAPRGARRRSTAPHRN